MRSRRSSWRGAGGSIEFVQDFWRADEDLEAVVVAFHPAIVGVDGFDFDVPAIDSEARRPIALGCLGYKGRE